MYLIAVICCSNLSKKEFSDPNAMKCSDLNKIKYKNSKLSISNLEDVAKKYGKQVLKISELKVANEE